MLSVERGGNVTLGCCFYARFPDDSFDHFGKTLKGVALSWARSSFLKVCLTIFLALISVNFFHILSQPHLVRVDIITLALFEDSGWYKVNYEYADTFLWGKGILLLMSVH